MTHITLCTAGGEMHGLINKLPNSVPFDDFKNMTPANKAKCEKEKKEDNRLVKARYINYRGRHERLTKTYCRYAGDPLEQYHLIPGYTYDLPMGFINEVNEISMPKREGLVSLDGQDVNKDGSPLQKDTAGERIHELVPVTF